MRYAEAVPQSEDGMGIEWVVGLIGALVAAAASVVVWVHARGRDALKDETQRLKDDQSRQVRDLLEQTSNERRANTIEMDRVRSANAERDAFRREISAQFSAIDTKLGAIGLAIHESREAVHVELTRLGGEHATLCDRIDGLEKALDTLDNTVQRKRKDLNDLMLVLAEKKVIVLGRVDDPHSSTGAVRGGEVSRIIDRSKK